MNGTSYEPGHCIICGHTEAEVIATRDDLRDEVEALWAYHQKRLRPDTPAERLTDRVAFSEAPPLQLVRCNECGLVYRNPVERVHELTAIYARETPPHDVLRALHDTQVPPARTQAKLLRRMLGRAGTGLEVGSYVGAFLAAAREAGLQVEGLDINADVNAFTRAMGFTVHDGELQTLPAERRFDSVSIWNTFDQLADPRAAVAAAHRILSPGGVLAIRVPNGAFYGRARRHKRDWPLLAQNNLLSFPYRWGFTPRCLARLLRDAEFVVAKLRGDVLVPIADEWTLPWARREERAMKRAMRTVARLDGRRAPWFEIYARRS